MTRRPRTPINGTLEFDGYWGASSFPSRTSGHEDTTTWFSTLRTLGSPQTADVARAAASDMGSATSCITFQAERRGTMLCKCKSIGRTDARPTLGGAPA